MATLREALKGASRNIGAIHEIFDRYKREFDVIIVDTGPRKKQGSAVYKGTMPRRQEEMVVLVLASSPK
jgi:hypothetical protein